MFDLQAARRDPDLIEKFLRNVRGTIPLTIDQIEVVLRLIAAAVGQVENYLDLSCGGGVIAPAVLDEFPNARLLVIDSSAQHLEAARTQLGPRDERAAFQLGRFQSPDWVRHAEPSSPFDLVTSGVEIPLLPEGRPEAFFREIFGLLRPGGFFLAIDHVTSATRWTQSKWDDQMIEAIFGQELEKDRHRPRTEVAREFYEGLAEHGQKVAPLEVQCDWLRTIGFESVECFLKVSEMAIFGGVKPPGAERTFVTGG